MRFLIKAAFWFGLVLLVLPFFSGEKQPGSAQAPALKVGDAVSAAGGLVDYLKGLCGERPDVCVKGGEALAALGNQARDGAYVAYRLLDRQFASSEAGSPEHPSGAHAPSVAPALSPPSPPSLSSGLAPGPASTIASIIAEQASGEAANLFRADTDPAAPAALHQPMPYRPPVEDAADQTPSAAAATPATAPTTTGAIPLPRPRPKG